MQRVGIIAAVGYSEQLAVRTSRAAQQHVTGWKDASCRMNPPAAEEKSRTAVLTGKQQRLAGIRMSVIRAPYKRGESARAQPDQYRAQTS